MWTIDTMMFDEIILSAGHGNHSNAVYAVYNLFCHNKYIPTNGECDHGWSLWVDNDGQSDFPIDSTARIVCSSPVSKKKVVKPNSICRQFELSSTNTASFQHPFDMITTWIIMNAIYNHRPVYQNVRLNSDRLPLYLYSLPGGKSGEVGKRTWCFGEKIGYDSVYIWNKYCSEIDYPANGECTTGWYQHSKGAYLTDYWTFVPNLSIEGTEY